MLDLLELKRAIMYYQLKNNHRNLYHEIRDYFKKLHQENKLEPGKNTTTEIEVEHGRIDTRHYRQCLVSDWITEGAHWNGLRTLVEVERIREIKGKRQTQTHYYISSLPLQVKQIAEAIRCYWQVENQVHWVLDVTYSVPGVQH